MNIGDVVEDFTLEDQKGTPRRLSEFLERGPVVLFFYPMAMTKGCTAESCAFRDIGSEFEALNVQRIGISGDSVDRQARFSEMHGFDYPLLSDPSRSVAAAFGVKRIGKLPSKRQTFVIDQSRRIIGIVRSETSLSRHPEESLRIVKDHLAGTSA
ncbi:MAG: peroxiredoxin [Acidimicrobiales bacterium]